MKAFYHLPILALLALTPAAIAQDPFGNTPAPPPEKSFSLNFPGGPVQAFVEAVEETTGAPFNVIIPASAQDLQIPPVKVKGVTLRPLLAALSESSTERKAIVVGQNNMRPMQPGSSNIQYSETGFNFAPSDPGPQPVWQLTVRGVPELPAPPAPPPTVRFYQLKPLLEGGLKVEDITTAAETAWKMMKLAQADMPELKYHEETGLLIAAGKETALTVIDSVLSAQPLQGPGRNHGAGQGHGGVRTGGLPQVPPQPGLSVGGQHAIPSLPAGGLPGTPGIPAPPADNVPRAKPVVR